MCVRVSKYNITIPYSPCIICSELVSGTLSSNNIEDGTEIRLVPAVESGVTVCTCTCRLYVCTIILWKKLSYLVRVCVGVYIPSVVCACVLYWYLSVHM